MGGGRCTHPGVFALVRAALPGAHVVGDGALDAAPREAHPRQVHLGEGGGEGWGAMSVWPTGKGGREAPQTTNVTTMRQTQKWDHPWVADLHVVGARDQPVGIAAHQNLAGEGRGARVSGGPHKRFIGRGVCTRVGGRACPRARARGRGFK